MMKPNPCTVCGKPGIPGLVQGCGKCQYHWNADLWGKHWADAVEAQKQAEREARAQPEEKR